ncbi:tetratricopeptide repeat protein [Ventosimonas gracilis]|uniref:tetratricopeptide repeat protein n=1 Tax=Ventosimonas gracilis TaxID=1680762 RepID=UPI0009A1C30E|nr:tetratricopeptide repeat protein [Ventosimonas gracilis]
MKSERNWLHLAATAHPQDAARLILAAAANGQIRAQCQLGQILLDGYGIERDPKLARHWFARAASQGDAEGQNLYGRCLQLGWGGEVDLPAAALYYHKAAMQGLDWGQYNYAQMLAKGWGVALDLARALDFYRKAAAQGHAKALNLVGRFYEEGWVVPADPHMALDYYRRSAEGGDFRGQCSYASMLTARGLIDEAVCWLQRAMQTATPAFLQKMIEVLQSSIHAELRLVAEEMRKHLQNTVTPLSSNRH